jgi:hypothetical protein
VGAYLSDVCGTGAGKRYIWRCECCDGVGESEGLSECVWGFTRVSDGEKCVVVSSPSFSLIGVVAKS